MTIVWFHIKELSKEFGLTGQKISRILKSIGAKQWTASGSKKPVWYWED